ncbi:extracellular solute-binding protein [Paenibacillus sp. MSJ-34]|uniref:extracellular solute-binding protein n=1 Tax=Paenibacillus sp. MSJ-34 TaxID=2841529 RepID=UPI0020A0E169|nr:extracellular solute-binding protein [Paenibacillus sp. MSJ-34]
MNQKSKRRISLLLSLSLVLILLLSACGKSGSEPEASGGSSSDGGGKQEQVTIKYYNWDNEAQSVSTDAMLEEFMQANPNIKVEHVVLVPGDSVEMLKKLDFLISSGEAVDVVQLPSLNDVLLRGSRGALAPLNEFYEKNGLVPEDEYYVNPKIDDKFTACSTRKASITSC